MYLHYRITIGMAVDKLCLYLYCNTFMNQYNHKMSNIITCVINHYYYYYYVVVVVVFHIELQGLID